MGENQDLKFVCKFCNKRYPCGKSLGGHMRSHAFASSSESDEMKKMESLKMKDQQLGGSSSYGLRENPKKTWRAVDTYFPMPQEKVCKQCGKVFQSIKALCGHMACHSEKDKGGLKDEHSWTTENKKQKMAMDSNSDTEAEELLLMRNISSTRPNRYKKFTFPVKTCSESASEISDSEQDQHEVAKCLMMLSRDSWNGKVNSLVESSDNNSVVLETKSSSIAESDSSDSMYFLGENNKAESDVSVDWFSKSCKSKISGVKGHMKVMDRMKGYIKSKAEVKDFDYYYHFGVGSSSRKHDSEYKTGSAKKIKLGFSDPNKKYECFNCKKAFSSYQALGGHRPCNKRSYETGENSLDGDHFKDSFSSRKAVAEDKTKKEKGHKCPFCDRIFKSGQALGGHKRSHFIGRAERNGHRTQVIEAPMPDLLDLNAAPAEDENDEQLMWCEGR